MKKFYKMHCNQHCTWDFERNVCRDRAEWIGKQTLMWSKVGLCVKITQSSSVHLVPQYMGNVTCWNTRHQEEHLIVEIISTFSNKYNCQINAPKFERYNSSPCLPSNMKRIQQWQKKESLLPIHIYLMSNQKAKPSLPFSK